MRGLNRIHLAPPLNLPVEDARTGLAILDDALTVADKYGKDQPPPLLIKHLWRLLRRGRSLKCLISGGYRVRS
ncbi:hypothetical protein IWX65_000881 [Arthrobacter sp. CAN_A214]